MPRTPLLRALQRLQRADSQNEAHELTRADFARLLSGGVAGMVLAPAFTTASSLAASTERVAIVGAGIAGLSCALTLNDAGIRSVIFESSDRIGGRMHSQTDYWDDGQHTEWCGSMIDSKHLTLHALARRFGLPLVDSYQGVERGARDTSYFQRRYYPMPQADRDFAVVFKTLRDQLSKIGENTTYNSSTPLARELDNISMAQWLDRYVPGGRSSQFGRLIDDALTNEYGVDSGLQSSLNLIYMLGEQSNYTMRGGEMNVLGYSDQRYFIAGGNQRLPNAIAAHLPHGSIRINHRLQAIRELPGGRYELRFTTPDGTIKETYDRVVLALPFIVLRSLDYSGANFDSRKRACIESLGYGMHTKLQMQFSTRAWHQPGPWYHPTTGQIWTDTGFQNSVDFSIEQRGRSGIIEGFTAGTAGLIDTPAAPYVTADETPAVRRHVDRFFAQLDEIWPGVSKHWNGKATFGNVQVDPNIQASYSCWLRGQYTTLAGYERVRQGRVHFAGEHCSVFNQGFMEGAAETGVAAGREILADYNIRSKVG